MKQQISLLLLMFALLLTNCSDLKKGFGLEKDIPDEFLIKKINPIERPPNYELIPPDSKKEVKSKKNKNNNVRSLIDESLKSKSIQQSEDSQKNEISAVENEILEQIKKR